MSRPRFLTDQDFNDNIVTGALQREPAIQFERVREIGLDNASDTEILGYASRSRLIVVSHDVSTMSRAAYEMLAANRIMAGLILVHQSKPIRPTIDDIVMIWAASEAEEWVGQVRYLPL